MSALRSESDAKPPSKFVLSAATHSDGQFMDAKANGCRISTTYTVYLF